jgi:hypothetical protein
MLHNAGISLVAASLIVKKWCVAVIARIEAWRAGGNGSLNPRRYADERTF